MIIYSKATSGRCLIDAAGVVTNRTRNKVKTILRDDRSLN